MPPAPAHILCQTSGVRQQCAVASTHRSFTCKFARCSHNKGHEGASTLCGENSVTDLDIGRGQLAEHASDKPLLVQLAVGFAAALASVAIRLALPLSPTQLPTFTAIIAVLLVSIFVGARAALATAIIGGIGTWYFLFKPYSWELDYTSAVTLLGYSLITSAILLTTHFYRRSEEKTHRAELQRLEDRTIAYELFANEMAHRLKNALALVQSLASQTMGHDDERVKRFTARLQALANAHNLLGNHVTQPKAQVHKVVEASVRPFQDGPERFTVNGPQSEIASQQVVSLALAIHELATNAVKYGALSLPAGRVEISWIDKGSYLMISWTERGGPMVVPPQKAGFGSKLLHRVLRNTQAHYLPEGLIVEFELERIVPVGTTIDYR